nr:hypothetical protein [Candidatus Sigynarchaeum springense]
MDTDGPLMELHHENAVLSVAFSPDGKTLATGSEDKAARLWDVRTGKQLRALEGHEGLINSVAFSPNGSLLATGSKDKTARLWKIAPGKPGKKACKFRIKLAQWKAARARARASAAAKRKAETGKPVPVAPPAIPAEAAARPSREGQFSERITSIMKVSESLTVEQLAAALDVDVAFVWKHVFTWADRFGFKIVDGRVIFKDADIAGLAGELDKQFKEWESKEKSGEGKKTSRKDA